MDESGKKGMEELRKIARMYYNSSPSDIKDMACNFFKSLDYDGDDKVSLHEFLGFMRQQGHTKMSNLHFFNALDKDGSGSLDFMEVMALYYIIINGRPFCEGCDSFIPTMFFTCLECFDSGGKPFCVCPMCFGNGQFVHEHTRNNFVDNYALLEAKRQDVVSSRMAASANNKPSSSVTITELSPSNSTSNAMFPYKPEENPLTNLRRFCAGVMKIGIVMASSCTVM